MTSEESPEPIFQEAAEDASPNKSEEILMALLVLVAAGLIGVIRRVFR